jgi:hypothetical protein
MGEPVAMESAKDIKLLWELKGSSEKAFRHIYNTLGKENGKILN